MRECNFKKFSKTDECFINFRKNYEYSEPLNPRESLFGGRTNSIKL